MSPCACASGAGGRGELPLSFAFTGKEDDLEVGLTYFGKRYLIPALGTWASPDPLAVHSPGSADLNLYAYVHGQLLRAVDPTGLHAEGAGGGNAVEEGPQAYSSNPGVGGTDIAPEAATSGYQTTGRGDVEGDARAHHENALGMVKHEPVANSVMHGAVKEYGRYLKSEAPEAAKAATQTLLGDAGSSLVAAATEHALSGVKIPENASSAEDLGSLAFELGKVASQGATIGLAQEGTLAGVASETAGVLDLDAVIFGRAQTRINLASGSTRFTPTKESGASWKAGWDHVASGHFDRPPANNRSVFTLPQEAVRSLLQSKAVVSSPISPIAGGAFERTVDVGSPIGTSSLRNGGGSTSILTIFTDKAGNLLTAFPK